MLKKVDEEGTNQNEENDSENNDNAKNAPERLNNTVKGKTNNKSSKNIRLINFHPYCFHRASSYLKQRNLIQGYSKIEFLNTLKHITSVISNRCSIHLNFPQFSNHVQYCTYYMVSTDVVCTTYYIGWASQPI